MAIYDNDSTVSAEIGKLYDNDGTVNCQIGKVYDNDGTLDSEIYSAEEILYSLDDGINTLGDWKKYADGCPAVEYSTSGIKICIRKPDGYYDSHVCVTPVDVTDYSYIDFTFGSGYLSATVGVYTSASTGSGFTKSFVPGTAGTHRLDVSDLTGIVYLKAYGRTGGGWQYMYITKIVMS